MQVMELKGNIRVFCRVRPVLRHELSASGNEEVRWRLPCLTIASKWPTVSPFEPQSDV